MFDIRQIRDNPEAFDKAMARRGLDPVAARILAMDEENRAIVTELQGLQSRRNAASRQIGQAKAAGDEERARSLMEEVSALKSDMAALEEKQRQAEQALNALLSALPNLPQDDVPDGADEDENVEIRRWGDIRDFPFTPKAHEEIGEALGQMDFPAAARIAGSRFTVLKGGLARLERALAQFMLDVQTGAHGYLEVSPPYLVRDESLFGTGQLPKFAEDLFRTTDDRWLIPTAEVPLTNLVREQIVAAEDLPMRFTALTPCFRSEAGAAGKDTRGMFRQHQFSKVEMVSITTPEESAAELERMTACAEEILKRLNLPFRTVALCTGDLGFSARKTYDVEVWLPAQNRYREISSCSVCGDFQARRMKARFRAAGEKQTRFVHTLNGSGLAVGRALVAVLENYQNGDGSVTVPEALRPYMNGAERIG